MSFADQPLTEPVLKNIQVELSSHCNGYCLMCVNPGMSKKRSHMDLGLLRDIYAEAKGIAGLTEPVAMCGLGEPLMHPQAIEAFRIAASSGVQWGLGTNCSKLDFAVADALCELRPTKVVLSMDAMTGDVMQKIRPGLDQPKVLSNVTSYLEKIRARPWGGQTWVQIINFPVNTHQILDFLHYFEPRVKSTPGAILYVKQSCWMPRAVMGREVYPSQPIDLPEELRHREYGPKIIVDDFTRDWATRNIRGTPCPLPWEYALIRSDGEYSPCCVDADCTHQIGSIVGSGISAVHKGPKVQALRELLWSLRFGSGDRKVLCAECE